MMLVQGGFQGDFRSKLPTFLVVKVQMSGFIYYKDMPVT